MTMIDPVQEATDEMEASAEQTRMAALQARAQQAYRPVNREGSSGGMRWEGAPRGGNVEDRRLSPMQKVGAAVGGVLFAHQRAQAGTADVIAGAGAGIVRAPGLLVGSLMDFGNDTAEFVGEVADSAMARGSSAFNLANRNAIVYRARMNALQGAIFPNANPNATWSDLLSARESLGRIGNDKVNQFTAVVAASVAPALVTGGASTAGGAGVAARTAFVGAFGGGVVNDPYEERISNALQALGIRNEFTDWLAQDDEDGAFESRFKGAIEGVLAEGAAEGAFHAFKAARAFFRGDRASADAAWATSQQEFGLPANANQTPALQVREAAPEERLAENLDKSFAQQRTEAARAQQIEQELAARAQQSQEGAATTGQETTQTAGAKSEAGQEAASGVEELAQGTRRGDVPPSAGADPLEVPAMSPRGLEDANEALRRMGAPEQLTPENFRLTGDGRVIVSPATKRMADEAGFGRAFAESTGTPRDEVIFATRGRTVGTMGREDVNRFANEVQAWSIRGVDDIPATDPVGQFRITNLGDPEDVQPVLRAIIDRVPEKRTVSVEEMMAAASRVADEVGQDPTAMIAYAQQFANTTDELYAAIGATRTMAARLGANIDRHLLSDVDSLGDDAFEALAQDIRNASVFTSSFAQAKSGLGRGLYAARLPDADSYARAIRKGAGPDEITPINPGAEPVLPRTRDEVKDWLDTWKAFDGDPTGRAAWLENKFKLPSRNLYLRSSVANFFTANLLSAPRTLALNVVGPAVIGVVRTLEKTSGGFLGAMVPGIGAARRAELLATASAAPTAYIQTFMDYQDALRFGLQAMRRGEPILGGGGSIRDAAGQLGPITPGLLRAASFQGNTAAYSVGNVINMWPRALQRVNAGMDEFAKRLSYMGEARASFLVEGSQQGLRGRELNEYVRERLTSTTDILGHAESDSLLQRAERSTFTGEVGSEGSIARGFASGVANARRQFPESRFLLPIFNVPANALGETLRRVPGVNFLFKESNSELAGALGPVVQAEAYGRFVTGAALLGSGFGLTRMGLLTGSGPSDPRDRQVWLQTHQPYSIRVGDQWVDYSRYDIVGALFAIPATLYDRTVNQRQDRGWEHTMFAGVAAMAEFMKDRAALQTLSDMLTFSGNPTSNPEAFFSRLGGSTLANLAVPNFVTALGRNPTDDVLRARASLGDYFLDKLPLASQRLDPMRNVLGEYVHKPQDTLIEGILPLTMSPVTSFEDDPELDEISRLYEVTGYGAGVISPRASMGGAFDPREVKLEGGWSLWDEVMRNRGTVQIGGRTLREALGDLFGSDAYADAVDADASNKFLSDGTASRGALVAEVFEDYTKVARQTTARESPIAARWLAIAKAKQTDDGRLRTVNAREAVENPDLLDSLGVDITTFEDALTQ